MNPLPLLLTLLTSAPDASAPPSPLFHAGRYEASDEVLSTPLTGFGLDLDVRAYGPLWLNLGGDWSPLFAGHVQAGSRLYVAGRGPEGVWLGWHYAYKDGGSISAHGPGLSLGMNLVSDSGFAVSFGVDVRYLTGTFRSERTGRDQLPAILGGFGYETSRFVGAGGSQLVPGLRLTLGFAGEPK